ncbi:MAG: caspase family protein [Cyanobacteriota bacterium]|nr:caspase family protein [Cyanobacteriota bacterium]
MAKVALLIGVSEYEPGLNALPAAVQDVEAIKRVLGNSEMGGFADEDITVLKNPQPQQVRNAIYNLFANRKRDDLVLFYFSGHGIKDEKGKLYLSTRATRKDNGKLVKPSSIPASLLHESINDSRSQRQVIILDCCFSGAIATGLTAKDDGSIDLEEQLGGKGRAILTSSSSTQYSFEQEGSELSIYTRYLVEGINTGAADTDGDGQISIDELHEYASNKVQEASPAMTPKFYPMEEGYKILLAKSHQDDPKLQYRKEVERRAKGNRGAFSVSGLRILELKRNELKLSVEEANAIQDEVLKPFRDYEHKCYQYEQNLIEQAEKQFPFNKIIQKDIKDLQRYLGLRNEDVADINKRVIAPKQELIQKSNKKLPDKPTQKIEVNNQVIIEIDKQSAKEQTAVQVKEPEIEVPASETPDKNLITRIFNSRKNKIAGIILMIVFGILGYQLFSPRNSLVGNINSENRINDEEINKNPEIKPISYNIETILNKVPEIKHASRLRKLKRRVDQQINQNWQNRQSINQDLEYRVITAGDGAILSYLPLNESAQKYINQTPINKLLYQSNNQTNQTEINNEPVAQFRVKFIKSGIVKVNPWIGYIYKTPDLLGTQITDENQIQKLEKKLYDNISKNWEDTSTYERNLKYRVAVTEDGVITDYEPLNKAAFDNFRKTPLPKTFAEISKSNIVASIDEKPLAHYQVRFLRNSSRLKIEPWSGYGRGEKD